MKEPLSSLSGQKRRFSTPQKFRSSSSNPSQSSSMNSDVRPPNPPLIRQSSSERIEQFQSLQNRHHYSSEHFSGSLNFDPRQTKPPTMNESSFEGADEAETGSEEINLERQRNLVWTDDMDNYLIDSLTDQMHKGQKIGGVFSKNALATVATLITQKFRKSIHSEHIKNRMKTLKGNFSVAKDLLSKSGFGFNNSTQMIEATFSVWEAYIAENPKASRFRYKPVKNYEKMDGLVGQDRATGGLSIGPTERQRQQQNLDNEDDSTEFDVDSANATQQDDTCSAATSFANKQPKSKKAKMDEKLHGELKDIKECISLVVVALEKSSKSNFELQQQISQEIEKVDGLSIRSQVAVYRTLTYNEKAGLAFLATVGERRRLWLEMEFGLNIFDA